MLLVLAAAIFGGYAYLHGHGGKLDLNGNGGGGGSGTSGTGSGAGSGGETAGAGGAAFVFATGSTREPLIYQFIDSAHSSIDMTMYELSDTSAVNDLIARKKAGVDVRVILDQAEKSTNKSAYAQLTSAGVGVVWSSTAFQYTHQKTLTVDVHRKSLDPHRQPDLEVLLGDPRLRRSRLGRERRQGDRRGVRRGLRAQIDHAERRG